MSLQDLLMPQGPCARLQVLVAPDLKSKLISLGHISQVHHPGKTLLCWLVLKSFITYLVGLTHPS